MAFNHSLYYYVLDFGISVSFYCSTDASKLRKKWILWRSIHTTVLSKVCVSTVITIITIFSIFLNFYTAALLFPSLEGNGWCSKLEKHCTLRLQVVGTWWKWEWTSIKREKKVKVNAAKVKVNSATNCNILWLSNCLHFGKGESDLLSKGARE